nr:phospholipase-like protein [Tanacetum cinerariifolium]
DLSRYNWATDRVHLTNTFDIILCRQGPLCCRFPWCKDHVELWVSYMWHVRPYNADWAMVGGYFVQLLLHDSISSWYADGTLYKVSWCDVEELGNNLVLSANYYVGDSRLLCTWVLEVNGHFVTSSRIIFSVPTPYFARLLGFNSDEEPIIKVDDIDYQMDTTLQVYHRTHEEF